MVDQTDNRSNSPSRLKMPAELQAFSEPCDLLPGESRSDFEAIRQMMVENVQPETNLEWLWTLDLIELSWEILRYRGLKQRVLAEYRHCAIREILLRLDGEGMSAEQFPHLEFQVGRVVAESMRKHFTRHKDHFQCSMISCTRRKTDAWHCFGKSASDASLQNALGGRQTLLLMESLSAFPKPVWLMFANKPFEKLSCWIAMDEARNRKLRKCIRLTASSRPFQTGSGGAPPGGNVGPILSGPLTI